MIDRKKLMEIVCNAMLELDCVEHCNFPLSSKVHYVVDELISHGVTVKEKQKPLTLEEVKKLPKPVYLEYTLFAEMFAALPFDLKTDGIPSVGMQLAIGFEYLRIATYGKTWRCWAEKPTEEERKAAKWE